MPRSAGCTTPLPTCSRILNALASLSLCGWIRATGKVVNPYGGSASKEAWLLTRAGACLRIHRKPDAAHDVLKTRIGPK
jgi:hypothetical protein